jgi:hypothetical protein
MHGKQAPYLELKGSLVTPTNGLKIKGCAAPTLFDTTHHDHHRYSLQASNYTRRGVILSSSGPGRMVFPRELTCG